MKPLNLIPICLAVILFLVVSSAGAFAQPSTAEQKPTHGSTVRLLTIGNSLSDDASRYLNEFAKAGGKKLVYTAFNIGGMGLKGHANILKKNETDPSDPEGKRYRSKNGPTEQRIGPVDVLKENCFDFVTLQQVSTQSFKPETFEPYTTELIAAIRKYAPGATVLLYQTWAYREDHGSFKSGNFTQTQMHQGIVETYRAIAKKHNLKVIPVGEAFSLARQTPEYTFVFPDKDFDYGNPSPELLPKQEGSLNVGWRWKPDEKTGVNTFALDARHCNTAGKYLAAAVFYEALFGENVVANSFIPEDLAPAQALALRQSAHEAVENERRRNGAIIQAAPNTDGSPAK